MNIFSFPFESLSDVELLSCLSSGCILPISSYENKLFDPYSCYNKYDSHNIDNEMHNNLYNSCTDSPYVDLSDVKDCFIKHNFSLCFLNIRSVPSNSHRFQVEYMCGHGVCPDILAFAETRLPDDIASLYQINSFKLVNKCRNGNGGGVCFHIRDKFSFNIICSDLINSNCLESLFVSLYINNVKKLIGVIYRPPSSNVVEFIASIIDMFAVIKTRYAGYDVLLCGDFNIDLFSLSPGN